MSLPQTDCSCGFCRLSIPNMEDLKRRLLKMVSNCNKAKVRLFTEPKRDVTLHSLSSVISFSLSVQDINARLLVRGVWRNSWWFPYGDGEPAGGGAKPAVARRGESVGAALNHLSEPVVWRLARPPHTLTPVPARPRHVHHWGRTHTQVCHLMKRSINFFWRGSVYSIC